MLSNKINDKAKLLLLTKHLHTVPTGGRELLCKLNHDVLKEIYGQQLVLFELPNLPLRGVWAILRAFNGFIDGLDEKKIDFIIQMIQREKVGKVFVDGSNFGAFVKILKERMPNVEISIFFHNVESRFFLGALYENIKLRAIAVLIANYVAERKSVRYGDKLICMSQRDSTLLQKVYGRSATHLSPMALRDKLSFKSKQCSDPPFNKFALFVGGVFYANVAGIRWFIKHVLSRIDIKVCIVGRGFEVFRVELEREGKVHVIGEVDDLSSWYRDAHFVIAPIFDGSGMKTKVAEALMFGKKVIGTPEAFSGYEDVVNLAGWSCSNADDFVAAISCAQSEVKLAYYPELRSLYEEKYSLQAAVSRFSAVLGTDRLKND